MKSLKVKLALASVLCGLLIGSFSASNASAETPARRLIITDFPTITLKFDGEINYVLFSALGATNEYKAQVTIVGKNNPAYGTYVCWLFYKDRQEGLEMWKLIKTSPNLQITCRQKGIFSWAAQVKVDEIGEKYQLELK